MSESNSRDVRYVLVEDDGNVSVLEPLEDLDAGRTPEERKALLDYLEKSRKLYQRSPQPPDAAPPQIQ